MSEFRGQPWGATDDNFTIFETPEGKVVKLQNDQLLNHGQYGIVYAAKVTDFGGIDVPDGENWDTCAVKYFAWGHAIDDEQPHREKIRKIRNVIRLRHKNVVPYYCHGAIVNRRGPFGVNYSYCLLQELCADKTLHNRISQEKEILPKSVVKDYTLQILQGLAYLHEKKIVHTDLKAENILLTNNYLHVKIGDVDAHAMVTHDRTKSSDVTHRQGTWKWWSPEMILLKVTMNDKSSPTNVGRKTDIWSLGCVVLEMVTKNQHILVNSNTGAHIPTEQSLLFYLRDGYQPSVPETLDADFKHFLSQCFQVNQHMRPSTNELIGSDLFRNMDDIWKPVDCDTTSTECIVVAGGVNLSSVEKLHPGQNRWTSMTDMPTVRRSSGAAVLDRVIYVVGGTTDGGPQNSPSIRYDPEAMTWTQLSNQLTLNSVFKSVVAFQGSLYAAGYFAQARQKTAIWRWDPREDHWTDNSTLNTFRRDICLAAMGENLYACGGIVDNFTPVNTVERYDPRASRWQVISPMQLARSNLGMSVLGRHLYAVGGYGVDLRVERNTYEENLNSCERFDPVTGVWEFIPDMNQHRSLHSVTVADNKLYVLGGNNNSLATVDVYDPRKNKWKYCSFMLNSRSRACAVTYPVNLLYSN